jgi:hypothetical protein
MATIQETACTPGREQVMVDGGRRSATYVAFIGFVDLFALSSLFHAKDTLIYGHSSLAIYS